MLKIIYKIYSFFFSRKIFEKIKNTLRYMKHETNSYFLSFYGYFIGKIKQRKNGNLEIGSGGVKREGFLTLDLSRHVDVPFDLSFGLPFSDGQFDLIFAEHVFEHFQYKQIKFLFSECARCLKPGGKLKIVVPDTKIWIDAFYNDNFDRKKYCGYDFGLEYLSEIDYLNYIFYMDNQHKYMFDRKNIIQIFLKNGFKDVKIGEFDPSIDKIERKETSLYAEGTK